MAQTTVRQRADDAFSMAAESIAITQAQGFVMGALMATLRDIGVLSRDIIGNIFIGAAQIIDETLAPDGSTRQTLAVSREYVEQMARSFGTIVPAPGEAKLPRRN